MKKLLLKIGTSVIAFIGVLIVYFVSIYETNEDSEQVMQSATLPIVNMVYQDANINMLQGYTTYMDGKYMRDCITPLDEQRTLGVNIRRYGNVIATMSYEIRSLDTERLIDKQNIEKFVTSGDNIYATIDVSNIVEKDTEYLLIIELVSEKHGNIYYYTRIEEQTQSDIKEHIDFVSAMSISSLDDNAAMDFLPYLEPSSLSDSTNLGYVNIKSSFSSFTWGDLKVSRVTEPMVTIKEILDDFGSYELQYKVMASNEYGIAQYYNVTEYYRIKKNGDVMYLYVYERKMEQILDGRNHNVSTTRINLGIDSDLTVDYSYSPRGNYVSLVKERNLWLMDMSKNQIINVFSFESGSDNDVRDVFDENDIEIISTDGDGNVLFIVYGYMNKGGHEGKVGTALYRYERESNKVTELAFVPSTKPFYILNESMGKFAYIKDDNLLYLMIDDAIYTVTFDSNEYVQLVSGLKKGNYIISDDKNIIAWHENTTIDNADSIRVINIKTGDDYIIEAAEGEYIKAIGFIEHDLIYGAAKQSDVYVDQIGDTIFPMYKLSVMLESKENVESYQKENIYVSDVSIEGNMLKLKRMSKDENGSFVNIEDDQYINKNVSANSIVELSIIATDLKKKELILEFAYTITSENELEKLVPDEIAFIQGNSFEPIKDENPDMNLYVYADGELELVTEKLYEAINTAYENYGVVIDGNGNYVWARAGKVNSVGIDMKYMVGQGYDSFDLAADIWDGSVLDVSKAHYDTMFYYVTNRMPVLIMVDDYGLVCVDGYNGYQGAVGTVYMTDLDTGIEFDMGYYELENIYNDSGMRYMVLGE
ncbi:MAG: hypothetical protein IJP13_06405 [Lachnospiraceae bacterium]|nr:hypothetical protein [Lachnospiraceae bacterium]